MIQLEKSKVCGPQEEEGERALTYRNIVGSVDALKCIAWGGRALVVGFAGGAIEQVRTLSCWKDVETIPDHPSRHLRFMAYHHQLPLNLVLLKNVSVVGIFWGSYTCTLVV
jgi:hypothetical protein